MPELSDNCLRCGVPIEQDGTGIDGLCWPPGSADYFVRHLFSKKWAERKRKRDAAKLEAWTAASEVPDA